VTDDFITRAVEVAVPSTDNGVEAGRMDRIGDRDNRMPDCDVYLAARLRTPEITVPELTGSFVR
jgi:hypothetical protein